MKKIVLLVIILFLAQVISITALTASDAKQNWLDAKKITEQANKEYKQAQLDYTDNPTNENNQRVIDAAKDVLNAALDEAEAWLEWKNLEAKENPEVPDDLKDKIENDVNSNLAKIDELRGDVSAINTRAGTGIVFLKIIGKYAELLADVARNSGYMWVHIANDKADKIEDYEAQLRESAAGNDELIAKLDIAKSELAIARSKIDMAENAYDQVKIPGTPLIKFAEGNGYLRQARTNLINAHVQIEYVYITLTRK